MNTTPSIGARLHHFTIKLTVTAPVLVHATGMGRPGLDSPTQRDAHGRIILPGTLVHGRVRAALTELAGLIDIPEEGLDPWFGTKEQKRHAEAKRVVFDDLVCQTQPDGTKAGDDEIVRISMDPKSGTVAKGMLQIVEAAFLPGTEVTFTGGVRIAAPEKTPEKTGVEDVRKLIEKALRWNTQVGALRTLGFGRITSAELEKPSVKKKAGADDKAPSLGEMVALTDRADKGRTLTVALRFNQPFCIPDRRLSNNLFESAVIIPGSTIKGAIAAQWRTMAGREKAIIDEGFDGERSELGRAFHRLRVSHFVPVRVAANGDKPARRPVVLPLSLGAAPDNSLWDMIDAPQDVLFQDPEKGLMAPLFAPDWKPKIEQIADAARGWDATPTDMRIRTSIDHDRRRVTNAELFAYETVVPDDFVWIGEIGLNDPPEGKADDADVNAALSQLQSLLQDGGLWWVGKTKASARVLFDAGRQPVDHISDALKAQGDGPWTVVLQTPALMLGPGLIEGSGPEALKVAYQAYWRDASGGTLELEVDGHWSRQRLWGGPFAANAYQKGQAYRPFVLTEPGAVFRLRAVPEKADTARAWLEKHRRQGLPLTGALAAHYGLGTAVDDFWLRTPFVPENGYGAFHLNPKDASVVQRAPADPKDRIIAVGGGGNG
jgi:CRISPR/Cas system CSM-associated protein Csm3 (group 7 of RAMP superfamily)